MYLVNKDYYYVIAYAERQPSNGVWSWALSGSMGRVSGQGGEISGLWLK